MDNATREARFARCYALWAAATNRRNFRTHQQDQTASPLKALKYKVTQLRAARAAMKAADRRLWANTAIEERAGIHTETPTYQRLNQAANDAAANVPWWLGGTRKNGAGR